MNDIELDNGSIFDTNFLDFIGGSADPVGQMSTSGLLNAYVPVFLVSFIVTILLTPVVRQIAISSGVIDHPDGDRKVHKFPVAYLGGLAILGGLCAGLLYSYIFVPNVPLNFEMVPIGVLLGMFAICMTGFMDDVWQWDPRLKIAGQLVAAAGLTLSGIGTNVATGILVPFFGVPETVLFSIGDAPFRSAEIYYWVGTFLTAFFVIGGCNAANLIDGLDGLLTGTSAVMAIGFLVISLLIATGISDSDGERQFDGARIILCFSLLGVLLGFLPYNFNPAVIFLGDCGSLLIGYMCVVIILMLGEMGYTHLVIAGLFVFSLPIMDTVLAIIRRKLAGLPMSAADSGHIHHMLLRYFKGNVRKSVLSLYFLTSLFALFGITLASLFIFQIVQGRFVYAAFLVVFSFICVLAIKTAIKKQWENTETT
jgi:UDP-GlcNAc:undecaprenyl-phosphate GlcNAc-1-phosphate transferase